MLVELFAAVALFLIYFYTTFRYKTQLWKRRGVRQPEVLFPWGNTPGSDKDVIFNKGGFTHDVHQSFYRKDILKH